MGTVKFVFDYEMPMLGFGTWNLRGKSCKRAVKMALSLGYTHFDTAWMYGNQQAIGDALKESDINRDEFFVTSKVWHTHLHYDGVLTQCAETLKDLHLTFVDLFLIHQPNELVLMSETFRALKKLLDEGKVRKIGVSNFSVANLEEAHSVSKVPFRVNQIQYHPGSEQREVLQWCREHDVVVTAHTPLGRGNVLQEQILVKIGHRYGKTSAQVALRWLVQQGMVVIPKASSEAHMKENMDVFNWSLSAEDMERISQLSDRVSEVKTI